MASLHPFRSCSLNPHATPCCQAPSYPIGLIHTIYTKTMKINSILGPWVANINALLHCYPLPAKRVIHVRVSRHRPGSLSFNPNIIFGFNRNSVNGLLESGHVIADRLRQNLILFPPKAQNKTVNDNKKEKSD